MVADQARDNTDPRQHKDNQADYLNEDVDQNARHGELGGDAKLREESCPDDVAPDNREWKERIKPFADKPQEHES